MYCDSGLGGWTGSRVATRPVARPRHGRWEATTRRWSARHGGRGTARSAATRQAGVAIRPGASATTQPGPTTTRPGMRAPVCRAGPVGCFVHPTQFSTQFSTQCCFRVTVWTQFMNTVRHKIFSKFFLLN